MLHRKPVRALVATASILSLALLSACGSDGGSASSSGEKVQVMMFPGQSYRLPVLVAQNEGYFKDNGLDVSFVAQPNNLQGAQALTSTRSQVGYLSGPAFAQGVEAGIPLAYFCGGQTSTGTSLIAKKGSSLPSLADGASWQEVLSSLSGKTVGVQTAIGSGLQLLFAAALEEAGAKDVTYVNIGGGNDVAKSALENGSVDVAQVSAPGTQSLADSVDQLAYLPGTAEAYKLYGLAWTAPTEWLKDNPETAAKFCDAIEKSVTYIKDPANQDTASGILADDTGLDAGLAAEVVKDSYKDYTADLPEDQLRTTFDYYAEVGVTKSDLSDKYADVVQPAND
ncbi:ABC transporter substrate-binding protein [Rhodococcus opacus]|nr:ABC transporter substrate-binding protein [Rhodococcus opacus]